MSSKGVAVVTDAGRGVGRSIALRLADDGFDIAVNDVEVGELRSLVDEIKSKGRQSSIHIADVSMEDSVKKMVEDVVKEHGGLDVMVANAGIGRLKTIIDSLMDDWDRLFAVTAKGTFLCYKYAAQQMIKQGRGGRIIGASSLSKETGSTNVSVYCKTKFAIRAFTHAAAVEFGRHGITVNAYAPGAIEIPSHSQSARPIENDVNVSDCEGTLKNSQTSERHDGMPTEVASLVSYLASKESHSITGQTISCDES